MPNIPKYKSIKFLICNIKFIHDISSKIFHTRRTSHPFLERTNFLSPNIISRMTLPKRVCNCFWVLVTNGTINLVDDFPFTQVHSHGQYVMTRSPKKVFHRVQNFQSPQSFPKHTFTLRSRGLYKVTSTSIQFQGIN